MACNINDMLEQATAFHPTHNVTGARPDAAYGSWRASMEKAVMRHNPESRTAGPIPTFGLMMQDNLVAAQAYAPAAETQSAGTPDIRYTNEDLNGEYTFGDVVDIINPLHHLPVIGTIYRKLSGDSIKAMSNIIGGAIFGGPVGAVSSTINAVVKSTSGKDIAENALALVGIDAAPSASDHAIKYETTAAFAPANNLAQAKDIEIRISNATSVYETADGRKNFVARTTNTASWNA